MSGPIARTTSTPSTGGGGGTPYFADEETLHLDGDTFEIFDGYLGDAALLDTGTTGGTVAAGDHTHSPSAPAAHAATHNGGPDPVTPAGIGASAVGHIHGPASPAAHASTHATGGTDELAPIDIGAADVGHTHGAAAPAPHAVTHATGGSDEIEPGDIGASPSGHNHSGVYSPVGHGHANTEITGLGTASTHNVPASGDAAVGEVVKGSDTRLTNARTPTAHTHPVADITGLGGAAVLNVGTGAGTVAAGDDSRFAGRYAANVGNSVLTGFTLTHNLNSYDVTVEVFRNSSPRNTVICGITRFSPNVVIVNFGSTVPTTDEFRVVIKY